MKHTLLLLAAILGSAQNLMATNRGFMPGDAFFHSVLTQDDCEQLTKSPLPTLEFVRPKGEPFTGCGYAGYWSLQLPAESAPLFSNLSKLYSGLRRHAPRELTEHIDGDGKKQQYETNGFHIFVYNKDFDPLRYDIALRYNETWVADESSFGPHPSITHLESFVIDSFAFSNDWRDAAVVAPLKTECPPIPDQERRMKLGMGNKRIDESVLAKGDIQIIVTASPDLRRYVHRKNGTLFYSVTNEGIKQYQAKNGDWVVTDWDPAAE